MKLHIQSTDLNTDPLSVFEGLVNNNENCFLLETKADEFQPLSTGQSYIGVAPRHVISSQKGRLFVDGKGVESADPLKALGQRFSFDGCLPNGYMGGLVGYFSHEGVELIEPVIKFNYPREFKDFEFGEYRDGLIFRPKHRPEYFYYDKDRYSLYKPSKSKKTALSIDFVKAYKHVNQYHTMINKALRDISKGRVFQVVLANKYEYRYSGDLINLYRNLRKINPSPFMFFLKFGDTVTIGASPELLVHTSKGKTYLEALAGTIRRGRTPDEDKALALQLLADEKEVAEHSMLVDLARNDVGRVSKEGTVNIDDLMYIKKSSHVQHICSIVSGTLAEECNCFDAHASAFPAGTLTGAPKIEAIKMLAELEGSERGPYGGTVGYFSYNGSSSHAVNIRSISAIGPKLYMHSGSGIVYDSQDKREYLEISAKKAAMDKAMRPFLKAQQ